MTSPEVAASGILVIDKPEGWTSHQVVGRIRRLVATRKVGHAGTLDPMATGVLVVGVNRATRLLGQLMLTDKGYTATVRLGESTITDDAEGEVTSRRAVVDLDHDHLESALEPLRGDILQVPSAVSAIKINGVRSYAKVRAGETVDLAARPVRVSRLDVIARRDAGRDKHVFELWRHLDEDLRRWADQPGLRLDTSDQDAAETVRIILQCWDGALVAS